jgi:hypothetical protein
VVAGAAVIEIARQVDAAFAAYRQPCAASGRALADVAERRPRRARDPTLAAVRRAGEPIGARTTTRSLSRPHAGAVGSDAAALGSIGRGIRAWKVERGRAPTRRRKQRDGEHHPRDPGARESKRRPHVMVNARRSRALPSRCQYPEAAAIRPRCTISVHRGILSDRGRPCDRAHHPSGW